MYTQPGAEPIADDELLYRRVPVSKGWYSKSGLSPEAFDPRADETTGISLYRAKYKTIEQAAVGLGKQGYYVAVFLANRLSGSGIECVPRPEPDDPGHVELPGLTCDNRLTDDALSLKAQLATLHQSVEGPFRASPQ